MQCLFGLAESLAEVKKADFSIHLSERIFMLQGLAEKRKLPAKFSRQFPLNGALIRI